MDDDTKRNVEAGKLKSMQSFLKMMQGIESLDPGTAYGMMVAAVAQMWVIAYSVQAPAAVVNKAIDDGFLFAGRATDDHSVTAAAAELAAMPPGGHA